MNMPPRVRIGSSDVARRIRQDIELGELRPRDRLPAERSLADEFGVARGTIREALNQLVNEGLIEVKRGSGAYVMDLKSDSGDRIIKDAGPLELIDARFALEPHICRLAVLHAGVDELERMEDLLREMESSVGDPVRFANADTAFHTLLAESTGNRLLIWVIGQISGVRSLEQWDRMRRLTLNQNTMQDYNRHHREVVNAIRAREPEKAAKLMKDHLEAARLSLTRAAAT
jgi:DNA-binding FadR family transcriptional regulator